MFGGTNHVGDLKVRVIDDAGQMVQARAIAALGDAVLAGGDALREVEINPLLVLPKGQGAVAVDALVLLNAESQSEVEEPA